MTIDEKIRDEKLQYDIIEKKQKYQHYHQEKLINMNILLVKKCFPLWKVKLTHSTLEKEFEKQIKTIEDEVKKQVQPLQILKTAKQKPKSIENVFPTISKKMKLEKK